MFKDLNETRLKEVKEDVIQISPIRDDRERNYKKEPNAQKKWKHPNLYTNLHSSTIHNSLKAETTQMSIIDERITKYGLVWQWSITQQ